MRGPGESWEIQRGPPAPSAVLRTSHSCLPSSPSTTQNGHRVLSPSCPWSLPAPEHPILTPGVRVQATDQTPRWPRKCRPGVPKTQDAPGRRPVGCSGLETAPPSLSGLSTTLATCPLLRAGVCGRPVLGSNLSSSVLTVQPRRCLSPPTLSGGGTPNPSFPPAEGCWEGWEGTAPQGPG